MNIEYLKLGDIATFINGYAFKPEDWSTEGRPIIRIQNLTNSSNEINHYKREIDEKYIVRQGDILISWSASIGIYEWQGKEAVLNQHIFKVNFDKINVDKIYFKFIVGICLESALQFMHGSTMKHITKKYFDDIVVPIPPLQVQQKLAGVLDKAQELIDKRKAQIEALDELVKSRFIGMFGDTVVNPKGWEKAKLSDYIYFLTSGSRGWSCYFSNKGEMFLTIKNVKNNSIQTDNIQYVIPPNTQEAKRTKVEEGDLLISITADLGRTGVVSKEIAENGAYINQHLSLVRLNKEKINPLFVSYFLESSAGKIQFEAKNQTGVKSGLNFDAIKSLDILVPPLKKQNEFTDFIKQVDKLKFAMEKSLKELDNNFNSLMQRAFNGELFN